MKATKTLLLGAVLLAGSILTSCSSNNDSGDGTYVFTDYVTLTGQSDNGSSFTMHRDINSNLITYTCSQIIDPQSEVKVGDRVVIMYSYPDDRAMYTSGTINLLAYQNCINGTITWGTSEDNDHFSTQSIQCQAVWMAGNYMNFNAMGLYREKMKTFKLVADEATVDSAMPEVYLICESDDRVQGTWKNIYASLDCSAIWASNKYDGFILHVANEYTGMNDKYEFKRKASITPVD